MDASVGLIGDLGEQQQVIAAKTVSGFPLIAVAVKSSKRDVETEGVSGWPVNPLGSSR